MFQPQWTWSDLFIPHVFPGPPSCQTGGGEAGGDRGLEPWLCLVGATATDVDEGPRSRAQSARVSPLARGRPHSHVGHGGELHCRRGLHEHVGAGTADPSQARWRKPSLCVSFLGLLQRRCKPGWARTAGARVTGEAPGL